MARVVTHSSSDKGVVKKMTFQTAGLFVVLEAAGQGLFLLRRWGKPASAPQKFSATNLYMLPRQILPCDAPDTSNMRYLNTDFAPLHHPLGDSFDISGYNTHWFDDEPPSAPATFVSPVDFATPPASANSSLTPPASQPSSATTVDDPPSAPAVNPSSTPSSTTTSPTSPPPQNCTTPSAASLTIGTSRDADSCLDP